MTSIRSSHGVRTLAMVAALAAPLALAVTGCNRQQDVQAKIHNFTTPPREASGPAYSDPNQAGGQRNSSFGRPTGPGGALQGNTSFGRH